jgi:hypothetical protein
MRFEGAARRADDFARHRASALWSVFSASTWAWDPNGSSNATALHEVRGARGDGQALRLGGPRSARCVRRIGSPELATRAVESVLDVWALPIQDLWAVFPTGGLASARARAFVAFVERCMAAPYATSSGEGRTSFILARNERIPNAHLINGAGLA